MIAINMFLLGIVFPVAQSISDILGVLVSMDTSLRSEEGSLLISII